MGENGESFMSNDPSGLSEREIYILQEITSGVTNKEIAYKLHISTKTVDAHRQNIKSKLHISSTVILVHWALKFGYIDFVEFK